MDELGTNEFVGLAVASRFRRYLEMEPSASFFDAEPGDFFLNTTTSPNEQSGWRITHVGKSKLTTRASSASRVVEVESTAGMSSGQNVLLTRTAMPFYGGYIDDWHADVIARVVDDRRIALANGIPGQAGTSSSRGAPC